MNPIRSILMATTLMLTSGAVHAQTLEQLRTAPKSAERNTEATIGAYAAGYKAGFLCSALFNGGKTLDQIEADELTGIYPLVEDQARQLQAEIDYQAKRVRVAYDMNMPPRISAWRPHLGCVDLPPGARVAALDQVLSVTLSTADEGNMPDTGLPWTDHAPVNGPSGNDRLDKVIDKAFTTQFGSDSRTSAVLIATPTAILAERYKEGHSPVTAQRTWSVAKSIGASVIGAAVEQGLIDVKAPAQIPQWQRLADPRRAITLENLLHMASGLDSNIAGNRTDRVYMGGGLMADEAATNALEAMPGMRWKYANNDTMLAMRAVRSAFESEDAYLRFPFEALLHPIGMTHTRLETDWAGDFIMSSQVWTTARDLARLGVLHLQDGLWDGKRILAKGWVDYVSTPAPAQPPLQNSDGSPRPGYGAQWWLLNAYDPALPKDSIVAAGNRGQYLVVIPSLDLVIVRRGYDMVGGSGFSYVDFASQIVAALKEN